MAKKKKIAIAVVAVLLAMVIGAGGYVGNMLGYFSKGNSSEYALENSQQYYGALSGKSIIFLGSSVTEGYAAKGISFVDYLEYQDGVSVTKVAKSGTTLVDDSDDSYIARMKGINTKIKADAFVCQLSTNDATKGKPLGEVSLSFDINDFDTHTVAGAIEYIIAYARDTWDCPVIFYTGTRYDSEEYAKMVDILLEIEEKWGINVIDLWHSSINDEVTVKEYKLYMCDDIHPTQAGYRDWWLPVIRESLVRYIA